jgi:hypothetical protein
MENDADRFLGESTEPGDPLALVLGDMLQNAHLRESSELAATVQAALKPVHPSANDRGVKQAGFAVLIASHMPAVLVEIGFGTNPSEATWLVSSRGQQTLADAIRQVNAQVPRRVRAAGWGGSRRTMTTTASTSRLSVELAGLSLQNPLFLASGTAGYGRELDGVIDLDSLGGLVTKAVSMEPRDGAPSPRVAEFPSGMLNAIGLANPGVEAVRSEHLPWLAQRAKRRGYS